MEVVIEKGHGKAALAYNAGMERAQADLVIFIHQDVYLPDGWFAHLERALKQLEAHDPNWGVVGIWGPTRSGSRIGHAYWTGIGRPAGAYFEGGLEVETLDEAMLIFRKSSGLRFDPQLPGYHMYGTDICLQARSLGRKSYVISALCIHNTNDYALLPWAFWTSYWFVRGKWRSQLPIHTSCIEITRWCWPAIWWNALRLKNLLLGRHKRFQRVVDPSEVYRRLSL